MQSNAQAHMRVCISAHHACMLAGTSACSRECVPLAAISLPPLLPRPPPPHLLTILSSLSSPPPHSSLQWCLTRPLPAPPACSLWSLLTAPAGTPPWRKPPPRLPPPAPSPPRPPPPARRGPACPATVPLLLLHMCMQPTPAQPFCLPPPFWFRSSSLPHLPLPPPPPPPTADPLRLLQWLIPPPAPGPRLCPLPPGHPVRPVLCERCRRPPPVGGGHAR